MNPVDSLAADLLKRRTAGAIKALRRQMDADTGREVINGAQVSA